MGEEINQILSLCQLLQVRRPSDTALQQRRSRHCVRSGERNTKRKSGEGEEKGKTMEEEEEKRRRRETETGGGQRRR